MEFFNSSNCFCILLFLLSTLVKISTTLWVSCSVEEKQRAQIVIPHCSQKSSHISVEWFLHFVVDLRILNGTTLWCLDSSERCSALQMSHRYLSQISQCKEGVGVSHKWHRTTSWKLHSGSIIWYFVNGRIQVFKFPLPFTTQMCLYKSDFFNVIATRTSSL